VVSVADPYAPIPGFLDRSTRLCKRKMLSNIVKCDVNSLRAADVSVFTVCYAFLNNLCATEQITAVLAIQKPSEVEIYYG
jgi:hypothetical protein